jgi:hypothetical protein
MSIIVRRYEMGGFFMTIKKGSRIKNDKSYDEDKQNIISAIEEAIKELQECRDYFETVNEPVLVDYAIYKEAAARSKYAYLIKQAKKLNIKVSGFNIHIDEENVD